MEVLFRVRRCRNIDRFLKVTLVLRGIVYWGRFGISSRHIFVEKLGLPILEKRGFPEYTGNLHATFSLILSASYGLTISYPGVLA